MACSPLPSRVRWETVACAGSAFRCVRKPVQPALLMLATLTSHAAVLSQVANLYGGGVDKLPLSEREQYVIDHMDHVIDSAKDPLGDSGGRKWWQQAEDPWQCLAACFELSRAVQAEDPSTFMSSLPVQQARWCHVGTCALC